MKYDEKRERRDQNRESIFLKGGWGQISSLDGGGGSQVKTLIKRNRCFEVPTPRQFLVETDA